MVLSHVKELAILFNFILILEIGFKLFLSILSVFYINSF